MVQECSWTRTMSEQSAPFTIRSAHITTKITMVASPSVTISQFIADIVSPSIGTKTKHRILLSQVSQEDRMCAFAEAVKWELIISVGPRRKSRLNLIPILCPYMRTVELEDVLHFLRSLSLRDQPRESAMREIATFMHMDRRQCRRRIEETCAN